MTDWEKAYRELQEKVQADPHHHHYWRTSDEADSLGRKYLICYCGKKRRAVWPPLDD